MSNLSIPAFGGLTFVYMVVTETPVGVRPHVKVGISSNPKSRLASLQTGSPYEITIAMLWAFNSRNDAASLEREFHIRNSSARLSGEWFDLPLTEAYESLSACFKRLALKDADWELPPNHGSSNGHIAQGWTQ